MIIFKFHSDVLHPQLCMTLLVMESKKLNITPTVRSIITHETSCYFGSWNVDQNQSLLKFTIAPTLITHKILVRDVTAIQKIELNWKRMKLLHNPTLVNSWEKTWLGVVSCCSKVNCLKVFKVGIKNEGFALSCDGK